MNFGNFIVMLAIWMTSLPPLLIVILGLLTRFPPRIDGRRPRSLYQIIGVHLLYQIPSLLVILSSDFRGVKTGAVVLSMVGLYYMSSWTFIVLAVGFVSDICLLVSSNAGHGLIGFVELLQSLTTWVLLGWYLCKLRENRG